MLNLNPTKTEDDVLLTEEMAETLHIDELERFWQQLADEFSPYIEEFGNEKLPRYVERPRPTFIAIGHKRDVVVFAL